MAAVLDPGSYILGAEVAALENELWGEARHPRGGRRWVRGTEALVLGMLALGVGAGDEVITVSHDRGSNGGGDILMIGAVPVLIDVCDDTLCMDPRMLDVAITSRSKAVVPVHLYGHPADLAAIGAVARRRGIAVVEDCAQAQEASIDGRPVGTIGEIGCFSFYPTKTLGALGDGGMVTSGDRDLIERARSLRTYGWTKPQYSSYFRRRLYPR